MRISCLIFFSSILFILPCAGQITLLAEDLPRAGDTLYYSVAGVSALVQPGASGAGKNWNFMQLTTGSQYADRFSTVSGTNLFFLLTFGLPGTNFSNLAKTENNAPTLPPQAGIKFGEAFNFYRSTNNSLVQKGFGASVNSIPIPVPYSSPETIYVFPLNFGHRDTSDYNYKVDLPGIGYYGRNARRINHVDGWGTLKTKFGTFDALRIRSVLQASDSIALDTLGQGIRIPLPDEVKYKWVAKNNGWPLLEITMTNLFGLEVANRVVYRDFKPIDTGLPEQIRTAVKTIVYPNPASEFLIAETECRCHEQLVYEVLSPDGRLLHQHTGSTMAQGKALEIIPLSTLQLHSGLYFLRISSNSGTLTTRPFLVDNP
jgi:hypothetical protein